MYDISDLFVDENLTTHNLHLAETAIVKGKAGVTKGGQSSGKPFGMNGFEPHETRTGYNKGSIIRPLAI